MPTIILNRHGKTDYNFYHEATQKYYQRIVAGLVFPAERPGFVTIIAEEITHRPQPKLFWLAEYEGHDLGSLMEKCIELQADYQIQDFYARETEAVSN